jgi:beta-glucanase (GH16 family)
VKTRRLVWSDEFDGPAGAPPDDRSWSFELGDGTAHGNPGWGNRELQWYTDAPANAAHDGRGNLAVTARATAAGGYTSARLVTKGKVEFRYGRIETRVHVPAGAGLWPAVWALGADIDSEPWPACGEIDVMEYVAREPRRAFATIHGPGYSGAAGVAGTIDLDDELANGFHVFAAEWTPTRIDWSLDDVAFHSATPADVSGPWVFDHPFYVLVNLAVGGDFGGPVAPQTAFPATLLVDYVRVYEAQQPP